MFHACVVPPVIRLVELRHPKPIIILNDCFWAGAARRCAEYAAAKVFVDALAPAAVGTITGDGGILEKW